MSHAEARFPRIRTVLIVDDSTFARRACMLCLRLAGLAEDATYLQAVDGGEALKMLQEQPVDLIVSDLNMPTLDGRGLAAALDAEPLLRDVPLLIVSSDRSNVSARGLRHGPIAVAPKPVSPVRLARAIADLSPGHPGPLEVGSMRTSIVAYSAAASQDACSEVGMDGFFDKGTPLTQLRQLWGEWLRSRCDAA
ncbi:MAG: response regulator [Nannocystaceae bacterium]